MGKSAKRLVFLMLQYFLIKIWLIFSLILKRRVDSSDSDCAEANFEKKPKKATKKSKKANSDDEEFCTSAKLENTSEHKRTRKP